MNVTFTSQISIPRRLCRAINTPHLAWRRLRQLVTSSPHYMDSRPPRVARLHDQRKKSEQAPPQTIIDLRNMTLALPQDHVNSPLTMRGGDIFVSSDLVPARVSSGAAQVNKFARCSSEQVCQVLQKMMYDNCLTQI